MLVAALPLVSGCGGTERSATLVDDVALGGIYKVGTPYKIGGRWFHPKADPHYDKRGVASWYGAKFHGRRTANGERFDMYAVTAAHPTLPMPTLVEVTNLQNGRKVTVRVNDRGPFIKNREIDLSRRAAEILGFAMRGTARVRVRYIGPAPLSRSIRSMTPDSHGVRRHERPDARRSR